MTRARFACGLAVCLSLVVWPSVAPSQEFTDAELATLFQRQTGLADRYSKLEELLLRLADVEADENPERAALLRRAARQSRDKFTLEKLRNATESIKTQQFQNAIKQQGDATDGLQALLTLLLSEDRSKRIRDEKERVTKMIKDLKRIERAQRSTRARTENDADFKEVRSEQQALNERTDELSKELNDEDSQGDSRKESKSQESGESKSSESKSDQNQESESKPESPEEGQPKDSPPQDSQENQSLPKSKPKEANQSPSESQPSESQPSESQPSESSSGESKESPPSPDEQPQSPQQQAEQRLQQARKNMQKAEERLAEAQRKPAAEEQRQAEAELRAAIDALERILRQLREEEMQRELARLEARLKKMLAMQSKVLDNTVTLAATPESQRNRQTDLKAGELAFEEKKITLEADRAMLLLREEGSSVAFPEVVEQIRADTVKVAERLAETKIDAVTQGIQRDILAALDEMIVALQKAQRDLEKKKQEQEQGQQPQPGGEQEQPLVEALAELKLIRTMETRIKGTTERFSAMLDAKESKSEELLPLLQSLAERQNRLYRITRDLVLKRNQ